MYEMVYSGPYIYGARNIRGTCAELFRVGPFIWLWNALLNLLRAGALATSCKIKITPEFTYYDLHQNSVLGKG